MKIGDKVKWTYKHHLNSVSFTWKTKIGIVQKIDGEKADVLFEGNKTNTKVSIHRLIQQTELEL